MSDGFPRILTPFLKKELLRFSRKNWSNFKCTGIKRYPSVFKIGHYGSLKPISGMNDSKTEE